MSDGLGKQGSNDTAERKLNALLWVAAIAGSAVWSFQDVLSWNVCFVVSGLLDVVMWVTILVHHPSSKKGKIAIAAVVLAFSMLTALPMSWWSGELRVSFGRPPFKSDGIVSIKLNP